MKTIRVILTTLAFASAIASSVATSIISEEGNIFGHSSTGACVPAERTEQANCSVSNLGEQCTVFLEGGLVIGPPQEAPAFQAQGNSYLCLLALRRP